MNRKSFLSFLTALSFAFGTATVAAEERPCPDSKQATDQSQANSTAAVAKEDAFEYFDEDLGWLPRIDGE